MGFICQSITVESLLCARHRPAQDLVPRSLEPGAEAGLDKWAGGSRTVGRALALGLLWREGALWKHSEPRIHLGRGRGGL